MKWTSCYGTQSRAARNRRNVNDKVKSARASPPAFSSIASQPHSFSCTPKMARSAKCAFCVAMALGHGRQATGEILTGKSGLPELALLLSAWSPIGPVAPARSEPFVLSTNHTWREPCLLATAVCYCHLLPQPATSAAAAGFAKTRPEVIWNWRPSWGEILSNQTLASLVALWSTKPPRFTRGMTPLE